MRVMQNVSAKHSYGFYGSTYQWGKGDLKGKVIAEYVWIDGTGINVRSKQRTLDGPINRLEDLPEWNYDGSSTYQAHTSSSEVTLKPRAMFRDPFRKDENILVLCDTYVYQDKTFQALIPSNTNFRHFAQKIFEKVEAEQKGIEFTIKQQYTLFSRINTNARWPVGWPTGGFPKPEGPYYCGIGAANNFGRKVNEDFVKACLYAGVKLNSTKADVMPGQWEFEIGKCGGLEIGDHLWMARYLIGRVSENYNLTASFEPQAVKGSWHQARCHTTFSTSDMRCEETGTKALQQAVMKLNKRHEEHVVLYGDDSDITSTIIKTSIPDLGKFETTPGTKPTSIRIKASALAEDKGEIEDRRPSSNADPYVIASSLSDTICLNKSDSESFEELFYHHQSFSEWKKGQLFDKIIAS